MGSCLYGIFCLGKLLPQFTRDPNTCMLLSDLATDSHVHASLFSMSQRQTALAEAVRSS